MSDDFLAHYNRELSHIRRAAAEFAAEHPRIAGRLRMSADAIEDPNVGRLIESFAFLTARVRQKLDDDFPELVDALIGVLYPHYQRPIPSMTIVQMAPAPELAGPHLVPAGAVLDSEPVDGEACRFRTVYPVELHPLALRAALLSSRPFPAPAVAVAGSAVACLRLSLTSAQPDVPFHRVAPRSLRLHLRGQPSLVYALYELLLNDAVAVAFADGPADPAPVVLDASALRSVGFEMDEGLLDYPVSAHLGFRLLTEFFVFPEKFLFVDLALPNPDLLPRAGAGLDVFIYMKRSVPQIERAVTAEAFALGCTPAVNLFPQAAEPIRVDHRRSEYRVIPDSRRSAALEVYSVERVALSGADSRREVLPFYGLHHGASASDGDGNAGAWWLANRRTAPAGIAGSEVYLSLVDDAFDPLAVPDDVLSVDTLCMNRDLPERLPFGGGHPFMALLKPSPMVAGLRCLMAPTAALRSFFGSAGRWRLISHLTLNHLSLVQAEGARAIREILTLYDVADSAETRTLIDSIVSVSAKLGSARVRGQSQIAFCRGVDVELTLDESHFSGSNVFLMASVLERFFGLYASVNSFSRLTVKVKGRSGVLRTWPARAGERVLL